MITSVRAIQAVGGRGAPCRDHVLSNSNNPMLFQTRADMDGTKVSSVECISLRT